MNVSQKFGKIYILRKGKIIKKKKIKIHIPDNTCIQTSIMM